MVKRVASKAGRRDTALPHGAAVASAMWMSGIGTAA